MRTFTIPGRPTPKARPRVVNGHAFTPARTQTAEGRVLEHYLARYPKAAPIAGPVKLVIIAVFDVPASWSRRKREAAFGKPMCSRPDADNIAKLVTDALNGTLYTDDALICELSVIKRYAAADEAACLIVTALEEIA